MGEGDAEGLAARREPVGDGQRVEDAVDGERVHGHLRARHELLDEREPVPRGLDRGGDRAGEPGLVLDHGEAFLALAVDRLDDGRQRQPVVGLVGDLPARLRDAVLVEALALAVLEDGERAVSGATGCGSPAWAAMRAAMATGQSIPGAMIPSTCSARASWLIAASSSTETTARRSAYSKPTAVGSRSQAMT